MSEEKKHAEAKDIWKNIQADLQRARKAYQADQRGDANAISDILLEQFKDVDPHTFQG
jgi:hypothetical protein